MALGHWHSQFTLKEYYLLDFSYCKLCLCKLEGLVRCGKSNEDWWWHLNEQHIYGIGFHRLRLMKCFAQLAGIMGLGGR